MRGAIILAGGRSSRMKTAKEWLDCKGRPLLLEVLHRLKGSCERMIVVASEGQSLPEDGLSYHRINDPAECAYQGPFFSIIYGLREASHLGLERVYLSSSDAVGVSEEHVVSMFELLGKDDFDVVVPVDRKGNIHPLAAAAKVEPLLKFAEQMRAKGNTRLLSLFSERSGVCHIEEYKLSDPDVLFVVNTPEQWQEWLDHESSRSSP